VRRTLPWHAHRNGRLPTSRCSCIACLGRTRGRRVTVRRSPDYPPRMPRAHAVAPGSSPLRKSAPTAARGGRRVGRPPRWGQCGTGRWGGGDFGLLVREQGTTRDTESFRESAHRPRKSAGRDRRQLLA
jgi:hypothetical protein